MLLVKYCFLRYRLLLIALKENAVRLLTILTEGACNVVT